MRKLITFAVLLALALPAAALAKEGKPQVESTPAAQQTTASQTCKAQRSELGLVAFRLLHGASKNKSSALGKCVAKLASVHTSAAADAAKSCKAEMAMSEEEFKAAHQGKTFAGHYGNGHSDKNAYGKCVSQQASEHSDQTVEALTNAAKTCKAEMTMSADTFMAAHQDKTFAQFYSTNQRQSNAFGHCVVAAVEAGDSTETSD
jgi:hypothetical protein